MINIGQFKFDRLKKALHDVDLEIEHIHLAEKEDKWKSKFHTHKIYEFCFVLNGRGAYCIKGNKFNVEAGDLFIAKPHQKHYEAYDPSDPFELIFFTIKTWKNNKPVTLNKLLRLPPRIHIVPGKEIYNIFQGILDEIVLRRTGYTLKIKAYLINLLVEIYRFLYIKDKPVYSNRILNKNYKKKLADEICKYIENNYNKQIGLREISDEFHLASQYLSSFLKKQTGYSPVEYITKIRIDTAKTLLKNSGNKISAIALDIGYESSHYFHRMFKKTAKVTPTQYREKFISARS